MMLLHESLALERMTDRRQRAVADERLRHRAIAPSPVGSPLLAGSSAGPTRRLVGLAR